MWVYHLTPHDDVEEKIITNKYLLDLIDEEEYIKGKFTSEAVRYIRELVRPFITNINRLQNEEEIIAYSNTIPYRNNYRGINTKEKVLYSILDLILWDNEIDERGVYHNNPIVDPWDIYDYINRRDILRVFFNPPPVLVDVTLNNQTFRLSLNRDQVLGIMAVYRYLHLPHPFSMYGLPLKNEVNTVNDMALSEHIQKPLGYYYVNVGTDEYVFENTSFFQGLLTGAQWNGLDPHTFITNLRQWTNITSNDQPFYSNHQQGAFVNLQY